MIHCNGRKKINSISLARMYTPILVLVCAVSSLKCATVLLLAILSGFLKLKRTAHYCPLHRAFFKRHHP